MHKLIFGYSYGSDWLIDNKTHRSKAQRRWLQGSPQKDAFFGRDSAMQTHIELN